MRKFKLLFVLCFLVLSNSVFAAIADIGGPTSLPEGEVGVFTVPFNILRTYYWQLDNDGYFSGTFMHHQSFPDNGQHTLSCKVIDQFEGTVISHHTFEVTNVAPQNIQHSTEELSPNVYNITIEFDDTGTGDTHTYTVNGEQNTFSIPFQERAFSFTRTCADSPTEISVEVFDDDGASTNYSFSFTPTNYPPSLSVVAPETVLNGEPVVFNVTIEDQNLNEDFACYFRFRDPNSGYLIIFTSNKEFSSEHIYSISGTYDIQIEVYDNSNSYDFVTLTINVLSSYKPIFTVIPNYYVYEGEPFSLYIPFLGLDKNSDVTIQWGDSETTEYSISNRVINQNHIYPDPGTYNLTATVDDGTVSREFKANVFVKSKEIQAIDHGPVITSWEACLGEERTVYFSDDEGETFHIMGTSSNGYMIDYGDPDGYDDILGNDDDRPAPSDTTIRLYKVE